MAPRHGPEFAARQDEVGALAAQRARLEDLFETPQAAALATLDDGWHDIRLAHKFKYLGYSVGPGVTLDKLWEEARTKWLKRTRQLGATQVSLVVTMMAYKERCRFKLKAREAT